MVNAASARRACSAPQSRQSAVLDASCRDNSQQEGGKREVGENVRVRNWLVQLAGKLSPSCSLRARANYGRVARRGQIVYNKQANLTRLHRKERTNAGGERHFRMPCDPPLLTLQARLPLCIALHSRSPKLIIPTCRGWKKRREEEERSLIEDRGTQLAVAWSRHGSLVPRWTWPAVSTRKNGICVRDQESDREHGNAQRCEPHANCWTSPAKRGRKTKRRR